MGGDEATNEGNFSEVEGRPKEGFSKYIKDLYGEAIQLDMNYNELYILDLEELQNTIIQRRKGLAYKIWRLASFTKSPFLKNFPETPEEAMPELYPQKPSIPMPAFLMKKYLKRKGVKVNE